MRVQSILAVALTSAALVLGNATVATAQPAPPAATVDFQQFRAAGYTRVEADEEGRPKMECNEFHDGEKVSTLWKGKERKFICDFHLPIFSNNGKWAWLELMLA
ncbi:hypothetical protein [Nocardia sp. NPDC050435]|uniref:hypothetical protein n=1 Tax=Nocardia sp. NPDC050435 TaxID=3155040 RepID=UPI0033C75BB0